VGLGEHLVRRLRRSGGGFLGAEIDRRADGDGAHVEALLDVSVERLVAGVGIGEQFVVIELDEEGNLVGVLAGDGAEDAEGGGDGVAAAFDGELDDVSGSK
jgi:hypothetical protein